MSLDDQIREHESRAAGRRQLANHHPRASDAAESLLEEALHHEKHAHHLSITAEHGRDLKGRLIEWENGLLGRERALQEKRQQAEQLPRRAREALERSLSVESGLIQSSRDHLTRSRANAQARFGDIAVPTERDIEVAQQKLAAMGEPDVDRQGSEVSKVNVKTAVRRAREALAKLREVQASRATRSRPASTGRAAVRER